MEGESLQHSLSEGRGLEERGPVLHEAEARLVDRLLRRLDDRGDEGGKEGRSEILKGLGRLQKLWQAITSFPSVYAEDRLGSRHRNFETLVETFSHVNPYATEAYLPTRAVLGRGYAVAKFNFCRMLGVIVEEFLADEEDADDLRDAVEDVTRSSVLTVIAEDLLMSISADDRLEEPLRRRSATLVADLWEMRAVGAIEEFFRLLTSIWRAKASITINYGTLAGVAEMFCLARAGCDPEFLSYFCRDDVGEEEHAALLEFMFNATYEELEVMRRYMREHGVKALAAEDVARIFNVPLARLHRTTHTAGDIFFTFRERQVMASQRLVRGLPGPKKTAEEYVMIYFLRRDLERQASAEQEENDYEEDRAADDLHASRPA
jgi:hypothetical protein